MYPHPETLMKYNYCYEAFGSEIQTFALWFIAEAVLASAAVVTLEWCETTP
jgi:hypothetical protein